MKYLKLNLILLVGLCVQLSAQTKEDMAQAKIDYQNRAFAKALPVFEQEYLAQPTNPNFNLWYGVCLVETGGNIGKAEACLLVASKRNLPESYLYLGDIYTNEYKISEAEQFYAKYAKARPREKATVLEHRNAYLSKLKRFIRRTEDVQIIDSLVVDKKSFLQAYALSPDAGLLENYNDFFENQEPVESTVYVNGKKSKIYFSRPINGTMTLSSQDKLLDGYGNDKLISPNNFDISGDTNYPFVLTDGTTLYFAGKDSENGMGGYDIYVTRYNLNNYNYLTPEMMNMPFNSTANDYMMAFDDIKGVGWFASDRFQPEGKVCVYTFIPNDEVTLLDSDDDRYQERRAMLSSIRETWRKDRDYSKLIEIARKRPEQNIEKKNDFLFVINDNHTYHFLNDFKSAEARRLYQELVQKEQKLSTLKTRIQNLRNDYGKASATQKNGMSTIIIDLEKQEEQLYQSISDLKTKVRNEEIKIIR